MLPPAIEQSFKLAIQHHQSGRLVDAEHTYRKILAQYPNHAGSIHLLGLIACQAGNPQLAITLINRAIALEPNVSQAHCNLGIALKALDRHDEAIASFRRAVAINPNLGVAYSQLANSLHYQGLLDEALAASAQAMSASPDNSRLHSHRLTMLLYHPAYNAAAIRQECRQWDLRHAAPLRRSLPPHLNDPSPHRRLKIGYLSSDFCNHVVGRNILPFFRHHNHELFEIHCYSNVVKPDSFTQQFQNLADHWHIISDLDDAQVVQQIRQDRIDLLIDLALHTDNNRLLVFAQKPAPIQITFAGYPGATGLQTIDYRLTDPYLDPPNPSATHTHETPMPLTHSFWCYESAATPAEAAEIPAVNPLPALTADHITFGCLNTFCKVNDQVLELWAKVLNAVSNSHLFILAAESSIRQRTLSLLQYFGIAPARIAFSSSRPRAKYLELYHRIDIGLDTFPYNGHTTSLDSYYMGVPVVSLIGPTIVGRAGLSQLSNLNLPHLAAATPADFIRIAVNLASDLPQLSTLRRGLRQRMQESPLMNAAQFAADLEAAYRQVWRRYCESV